MITENEYLEKIDSNHRKKYAQFFTPEHISDFMTEWVLGGIEGEVDILEPAFGLGVFSRSLLKRNPNVRIVGYELDKKMFSFAQNNFSHMPDKVVINNMNYLTSPWNERYDGIICNPPYLKFHDYDNSTLVPLVNKRLNISLNGFANLYALFLLKSISQLKDGGRLAYIVPSEFLNSDYGVEVKRSLLESRTLRHVIIVDFNRCAFDDAITTACILFCEKTAANDGVVFSNVYDISRLNASLSSGKRYEYNQLEPGVKWKFYYEDGHSSSYNNLVPFSTFAKVSRGIATGANNYFTFKASKIDAFSIPKRYFRPCVCHSVDIQNLVFTAADFDRLSDEDKSVYLFDGCSGLSDGHVKDYIKLGKEMGVDKKYLTASRSPWYALENRRPSPIWVSVFNRNGLRFVRNKAGVYNLTTFHCVYNNNVVDTDVLFAYLVTNMAKSIFLDNSRQYGNGLLKFEPNDLNKGKVADLRLLTESEMELVAEISRMLQGGESTRNRLVDLLDEFFRNKFSDNKIVLSYYEQKLNSITKVNVVKVKKRVKKPQYNQLSLFG